MTSVAIPEPVAVARNPMVPEPYVLRRVARETQDTFTLTVAPESGGPAHPFQPGQFSMLWAFGIGEVPISISGDPVHTGDLTYTVRSVGATTRAIVSRKPGAGIGVRGPFGTGWPVDAARGRDVVIVAGGIGLAPLRPVIYHVLANRADYRRLVLLYGSRSPAELLYPRELSAWGRRPNTQVVTTVDYGGVSWRGHVGVVTTIFKYARLDPKNSTAMLCGPEIMMRFATRELEMAGLPANDIYVSMERNMQCGIGLCGHCQWGPHFVCKDGPVFRYDRIRSLVNRHEL